MLFIFMEKEIQGELKGFKPHQFKKPDVAMAEEEKLAEEENKPEEKPAEEKPEEEKADEETPEEKSE